VLVLDRWDSSRAVGASRRSRDLATLSAPSRTCCWSPRRRSPV